MGPRNEHIARVRIITVQNPLIGTPVTAGIKCFCCGIVKSGAVDEALGWTELGAARIAVAEVALHDAIEQAIPGDVAEGAGRLAGAALDTSTSDIVHGACAFVPHKGTSRADSDTSCRIALLAHDGNTAIGRIYEIGADRRYARASGPRRMREGAGNFTASTASTT